MGGTDLHRDLPYTVNNTNHQNVVPVIAFGAIGYAYMVNRSWLLYVLRFSVVVIVYGLCRVT